MIRLQFSVMKATNTSDRVHKLKRILVTMKDATILNYFRDPGAETARGLRRRKALLRHLSAMATPIATGLRKSLEEPSGGQAAGPKKRKSSKPGTRA